MQIKNSNVPAGCGSDSHLPPDSKTPQPTAKPSRNFDYYKTLVQVNIPASFVLPEKLKHLEQETYWFIHRIAHAQNQYKNNPTGFNAFSRQSMLEVLHSSAIDPIKNTLQEIGVIDCDFKYSVGNHAMGYRINKAFQGPSRIVEITKFTIKRKILLRRIQQNKKPVSIADLSRIDKHLLANLQKLQINTPAAYNKIKQYAAADPRKWDSQMAVDEIANLQLYYVIDNQGRRHTPITRLWSQLRGYLTIDNKSLVNIDIKNSQLVFLALLFIENKLKEPELKVGNKESKREGRDPSRRETPQVVQVLGASLGCDAASVLLGGDGKDFIEQVMAGTIYDYLLEQYNSYAPDLGGKRISTRGDFKEQFFKQVLYGENTRDYASTTPLAAMFQVLYPTVWDFILEQKVWTGKTTAEDAFKQLSLKMQVAESDFMIKTVCGRLTEFHSEIPILTIHDSILTTPEHVATVVRIIAEEFKRLGVAPKVKVEDCAEATPEAPEPVNPPETASAAPDTRGSTTERKKRPSPTPAARRPNRENRDNDSS